MKLEKINFETISEIWKSHLWPERTTQIEPISWINHLGKIDMGLKLGPPTFWGIYHDHKWVGVVSGFKTEDHLYRSRGLWVDTELRNQGLGRKLITEVEYQALQEACSILWTMPRLTSWKFYQRAGFKEVGRVENYEYGPHILANKSLADIKFFNR